jgi:protein arginine N-methyltransferase 5
MLTTPITNDNFHSRVLSLLSSYTNATDGSAQAQPLPLIPALENVDTPLVPDNLLSQLVAFTSSWIDLGSPDPVVAHLSRQVFHLEIAYAAFCGVINIAVHGPRVANGTNGIAQYSRAVKEALLTGSYVQLHILMPVEFSKDSEEEDLGNLAHFVRPEYAQPTVHQPTATFAAWDAWNTIRTICKYNSRLSVGKKPSPPLTHVLVRKSSRQSALWCFFQDADYDLGRRHGRVARGRHRSCELQLYDTS